MDSQSNPKPLYILHFNDVYEIEGFSQEPVGGVARFATICKQFKNKYKD